MKKLSTYLTFALSFALSYFPLLHAQTSTTPASDPNTATNGAPARAPDEATKKITELVHAGKYAEAQKLTTGLLVAYPNDQRLIKAKALIEKLLAPAGQASAVPGSSQPAPPPANANAVQLTGMDKVDHNALIVLAKQAQQTTDLDEQKKLLQQFMDQSAPFLQRHPDLTLLWQFRVISAISLNEPVLGYEAGQKLLAGGAADSSDPNLQQLLGELKNKGWLDQQGAEHAKKQAQEADETNKYAWIVGTWSVSWSQGKGRLADQGKASNEAFSKSSSILEGRCVRGVILDSGDIRWEQNSASPVMIQGAFSGGKVSYPDGWTPVISITIADDHRTMVIVVPTRNSSKTSRKPWEEPTTMFLTRID